MAKKWHVRPRTQDNDISKNQVPKKEQFKTHLRQVEYKLKHKYLTLNNVVLAIAVVLCLAWTWGSISSMTRNWELARTVATRQREKAVLELEVATLEMENEYYQSDEYLELAARKQENKKLPGETMVYLPENSEEAQHKHDNDATTEVEAARTDDESNLEQWIQFLFGA